MDGLSFDDLIPAQGRQQPATALSFDDLIPAPATATATPEPDKATQLAAAKAATATPYVEGGLPDTPSEADLRTMGAGAPGGVYAGLSSAMDAVPIAGPMLTGASNRAAALIRSVRDGTSYGDELARVQSYDQGERAAHPVASTVGGVVGGVAGMAPAVAAAPALFGAGEAAPLVRGLASTISGGMIGGADAGVRSDGDFSDMRRGAIAGTALGAAAPIAGSAVGAGVRKFYDMIGSRLAPSTGFGSAATRILAEDLANSGGVAPVRARLGELGPDAMLLDASPSLQGQAQGLASRPETMQAVVDPVRSRVAGTTGRLNADVDAALGPASSPRELDTQIKALRSAPNAEIGASLRAAGPVDVRPVLQSIDQRMQTAVGGEAAALQRARSLLAHEDRDTGWVTIESNPQRLHGVKGELDNLIHYGAPEIGIQPGSLQRQQSAIRDVRGQLNQHLRDQVPNYGAANDRSAGLARQADAAEAGYNDVMRSGPSALFPQDLQTQLTTMAPAERAAMAQGNRADVGRILGTNANDLAAMSSTLQGEGGFNTAKMGMLHGEGPTQQVVDAVARERTFADANRRIVEGAQSAQRLRSSERIAPREVSSGSADVLPGVAAMVGGAGAGFGALAGKVGLGGLKYAASSARNAADIVRNQELARAVTMQPGTIMDQFLDAIGVREAMRQRAIAAGGAARLGTQAAVMSQSDRARGYVPSTLPALPFAGR